MSHARAIEEECQRLSKDYPELSYRREGDIWEIRRGGPEVLVTQSEEHGAVVVGWDSMQTHCENAESAMGFLHHLLAGLIVAVQLYRNDDLAASWVELLEEVTPSRREMGLFLNPTDKAEWQARPDWVWREVRTVRRIIGIEVPEVTREERVLSELPQDLIDDLVMDLEGPYGVPPQGSRWVLLFPGQILVGLPMSFVERHGLPVGDFHRKCYELDPTVRLWITWGFRPSERPGQVVDVCAPQSIVRGEIEELGDTGELEQLKWDCFFDNGETQVFVRLELHRHKDAAGKAGAGLMEEVAGSLQLVRSGMGG